MIRERAIRHPGRGGRVVAFLLAVAAAAQLPSVARAGESLDGEYLFVSDSDGGKADQGSRVTIKFGGGAVTLVAAKPDDTFNDQGAFSVAGGKITLTLAEMGISCQNQPYTLVRPTLVLPFKVFSEGDGSSTWTATSAAGSGGSGDNGGTGKGDKGDSGGQGDKGDSGSSGSKGDQGDKGGDGGAGKSGDQPDPKQNPFAEMMGGWIGKGSSSELRFRSPNSLLILTVKHTADFFFSVNERGELEGEGTIEYDMEKNAQGLDSVAAAVKGMMGMMPAPSPPGTGGMSGAAGKMGDATRDAPGVTSLQYDATHLKNGKEIRHFKFKGHIEEVTLLDGKGQEARLYLELDGPFTTPMGKEDNDLIAAWEVNQVKEEKKFPCWSPFLKNPGVLRRGPGGMWMAEFQEEGTHRNGVKPWQEYAYVWMARQNK